MADVQIDQDTANIPAVNLVNGSGDPTAPGSGHGKLYLKEGVAYVRLDTGDPAPVGGSVALAEGQLAVGDGSGLLSALGLGTEGDVVTADANGMATWAAPSAPAGGGDLVYIGEAVAGAGGVATLDVQSIPGTYSHLLLLGTLQTNRNDYQMDFVTLRFNADSGAHYTYSRGGPSGSGQQTSNAAGQTSMQLGYVSSSLNAAENFSPLIMRVFAYADTYQWTYVEGTVGCLPTYGGQGYNPTTLDGQWQQTTAVTRITIAPVDGTLFTEHSRLRVYGVT